MAGAAAAALLDELMGRNRDLNPSEHHKTHWSDPEVCKPFLCAFCPYELFTNTRSNLGRCSKIHDDDYRESYKRSTRFEKMGYEQEFTRYLESLINDIDKKIQRGQHRLELSKQPNLAPCSPQAAARQKRIEYLTERINELVVEAEGLGCEGNVDQAQSVMDMCEKLREEKNTLTKILDSELKIEIDPSKAMQVCDVCGALLVQADLQLRPKDHYVGKQHTGYARIREYLLMRRGGVRRGGEELAQADQESLSNQEVGCVENGLVEDEGGREEGEVGSEERGSSRSYKRYRSRSPDRKRRYESSCSSSTSSYSSSGVDERRLYTRDRTTHYRDTQYSSTAGSRDRNNSSKDNTDNYRANYRN